MVRARPRTKRSPRLRGTGRSGEHGYVLIELILALVIASLLAALALPWPSGGGGTSELRAAATRIAVLLRTDRNAALRGGTSIITGIDPVAHVVRSGVSSNVVALPAHTRIDVSESLVQGVQFKPDGSAQGGEIILQGTRTHQIILRIDPVTAAVEIQDGGLVDVH